MNRSPSRSSKCGQAIIFLMMVMVIGLLVVLWNYDLHNIVSTKIRIGNAGDAAAQAAARWQGVTLNMVGELNLIQAALLCEKIDNYEEALVEAQAVAELRDRLALNGPLMGYLAAQAAATMNLNAKDDQNMDNDFAESLMARAELFMNGTYASVVEPPYDGAWSDYGSLLAAIASSEMVVECGNPKWFLFYEGSHMLLNAQFYNAIASRYWCWFELSGNRYLLTDYSGFGYWEDLPELQQRPSVNSEYFGTDLERVTTRLLAKVYAHEGEFVDLYDDYETRSTGEDAMTNQLYEMMYSNVVSREVVDEGMVETNLPRVVSMSLPWHFYEPNSWMERWPTSEDGFPFRTNWNVKYEYDYKGADAAIYTFINAVNITPKMRMDDDWIRWIAAAKPFGYLEVPDTDPSKKPPHYFGLVLPAFHDVRLIPNDISSRPSGISVPGWDQHIYEHLPDYVDKGISAIEGNGCWYCRQLITWENPSFRGAGEAWLVEFSDNCYIRHGGGSGGGGFGGTGDWR